MRYVSNQIRATEQYFHVETLKFEDEVFVCEPSIKTQYLSVTPTVWDFVH